MSEQKSNANDYALAYALNQRACRVLWYTADLYPFLEKDLDKINRNYIFLVQELSELYEHNKELRDIEPKPLWQRYKHIEGHEPEIAEHQDDRTGDTGQSHTAGVKRLCIINGKEQPDMTQKQKDLVAETDEIITVMGKEIDNEATYLKTLSQRRQITDYTLSYDALRGKITINGVYQLNKGTVNDKSGIDVILAMGMKQPNQMFVPELSTSKNYSSIISNAGFTPTLKKLFFPMARQGKGIQVRPTVHRSVAEIEGIDTKELDRILIELGANTQEH